LLVRAQVSHLKGKHMAERNNIRKKRKKRKNRKLLASTAAFITAAVVVVFCIYYVYYKTDYFNLIKITISGNSTYSDDYIIERAGIELGEKLFAIDRTSIRETLEKEVYIEDARVVYELPDKLYIEIREREEKYQVFYKGEYIIIDKNGIVLRTDIEKLNLITIESFTDVVYNIGDSIQFTGIESNERIFEAIEYLDKNFGYETIKSIKIDTNNSFLFETGHGTTVKIDLGEDIKYQIVFAMKIINERLNNNLTVSFGLIDFTKGDSPVYVEDYLLEEHNE